VGDAVREVAGTSAPGRRGVARGRCRARVGRRRGRVVTRCVAAACRGAGCREACRDARGRGVVAERPVRRRRTCRRSGGRCRRNRGRANRRGSLGHGHRVARRAEVSDRQSLADRRAGAARVRHDVRPAGAGRRRLRPRRGEGSSPARLGDPVACRRPDRRQRRVVGTDVGRWQACGAASGRHRDSSPRLRGIRRCRRRQRRVSQPAAAAGRLGGVAPACRDALGRGRDPGRAPRRGCRRGRADPGRLGRRDRPVPGRRRVRSRRRAQRPGIRDREHVACRGLESRGRGARNQSTCPRRPLRRRPDRRRRGRVGHDRRQALATSGGSTAFHCLVHEPDALVLGTGRGDRVTLGVVHRSRRHRTPR